MFKVNNKDSRMTSMTSFWCLYCWLRTYFTPCSSVSISNFEHVIAGWDWPVLELMFICQRSLDSSLIIFQATSSWIPVHEILKENTFLTHFLPLISFNTPWNIRKPVPLMFSGGIERWHEMAWNVQQRRMKIISPLIVQIQTLIKAQYLTFPTQCISESCIKIQINLNFYFHFFEPLRPSVNLFRHHKEVWK